MRILVVDDDLTSRTIMMKILCRFGECVASDSGREALIEFNHAYDIGSPFDLVSLDISLPDMSGIDVLKSIRAIEKEKKTAKEQCSKVMMVSAHKDHNHVIGSIQAGCNHFIVKPFDSSHVIEKVTAICRPAKKQV